MFEGSNLPRPCMRKQEKKISDGETDVTLASGDAVGGGVEIYKNHNLRYNKYNKLR